MTGGVIYIIDCNDTLDGRLNKAYVRAVMIDESDKSRLKA